jgi:hypothetical protein
VSEAGLLPSYGSHARELPGNIRASVVPSGPKRGAHPSRLRKKSSTYGRRAQEEHLNASMLQRTARIKRNGLTDAFSTPDAAFRTNLRRAVQLLPTPGHLILASAVPAFRLLTTADET